MGGSDPFLAPAIIYQHGAIKKATNNKHYTHTPSAVK
jgi:hypothetical protein